MYQISNLADLPQGSQATVIDIASTGGMRRRLQDLGLIKGTNVTCLRKSPLGDPIAYYIRGSVIALRSEDSSCVHVMYNTKAAECGIPNPEYRAERTSFWA
ncbi:MAG: ferrous iron transport protein A [Peptococcaceae bacterium]|nr:ferrous iron transport protein A [Peptococcaceae bacterium]